MEKETGSIKVLTEKGVRDSVCEEGLNTYSPTLFLWGVERRNKRARTCPKSRRRRSNFGRRQRQRHVSEPNGDSKERKMDSFG